jgi:hypothetical protein
MLLQLQRSNEIGIHGLTCKVKEITVAYLKVLAGHLAEETEGNNKYFITVINAPKNRKRYLPSTGHNIVTLPVNGMYSILLVSSSII